MNRQELKFDAKKKMRQAAVNPYVVTIIMGVIIVIMSVVQVVLNVWGELICSGICRQRRRIQYIRRFLYCIFCCLLIDQYNSAVWLQLLLFEGGEPGQFHVLRGFVFVAEISAEGHRTDAYDLNICYAVVSAADYTGYHCCVPLFPGHLHHG